MALDLKKAKGFDVGEDFSGLSCRIGVSALTMKRQAV